MKIWRSIWSLVRFQPWYYLLFTCLLLLLSAALLGEGLIISTLLDKLDGRSQDIQSVWGIIVLLLATRLANATLMLLGVIVETIIRYTVSILLRRNILQRILELPAATALVESPGEVLSRFRDDVEEIATFMDFSLTVGAVILATVVAIIIMVHINALITLVLFLPPAIVLLVTGIASTRLQKYRRSNRTASANVVRSIREMFDTIQAIKVANANEHVLVHFKQLCDERRRTALIESLLTAVLQAISGNIITLSIGIILFFIGPLLRSGAFTLGDFALFVSYLLFATELPSSLGLLLTRYKQAQVSFERMSLLLQGLPVEALVQNAPIYLSGPLPIIPARATTPVDRLVTLTARGLTYHYPGSARGISGIDLSLRHHSFTVITGRIGSGKTTLLRTLLGLLPREAGEIWWNNEPIIDPNQVLVPPRCAYTPQVPHLFSTTVRENILLGQALSQEHLDQSIYQSVMEQDILELDQGLDTPLGSRGVTLSGGQLQRTAAARMLAHASELLIFDDLSSALDIQTEQLLWDRLKNNPEATCLAVSHRRSVLERADHIIVLKEGRIHTEGSLALLLRECEELQHLIL